MAGKGDAKSLAASDASRRLARSKVPMFPQTPLPTYKDIFNQANAD